MAGKLQSQPLIDSDRSDLLYRIRQIPNHNTQIPNNIKIQNSNDQNISALIRCLAVILSVLNFGYWHLFEICILVLGIFKIFIRRATSFIPGNLRFK
jgi:hypothetical protein